MTEMEDDRNGRWTEMEDGPKWKTTEMEDDRNGRRLVKTGYIATLALYVWVILLY